MVLETLYKKRSELRKQLVELEKKQSDLQRSIMIEEGKIIFCEKCQGYMYAKYDKSGEIISFMCPLCAKEELREKIKEKMAKKVNENLIGWTITDADYTDSTLDSLRIRSLNIQNEEGETCLVCVIEGGDYNNSYMQIWTNEK